MRRHLTDAEVDQRARFDAAYRRAQAPVMLEIERRLGLARTAPGGAERL